jgi:hypothetical protein
MRPIILRSPSVVFFTMLSFSANAVSMLTGAKSADLPVEQPTKFELMINLKTAKTLGLKITPLVMMRAEKVIKWGSTMAEPDKRPVTVEELLVSSLAQTDALAKLLIEKGLITREEFMQKISEERATYQRLLNPTPQWQSRILFWEAFGKGLML